MDFRGLRSEWVREARKTLNAKRQTIVLKGQRLVAGALTPEMPIQNGGLSHYCVTVDKQA